MPRSAVVLGGSGLVGLSILKKLLASTAYTKVISIGRRRIPLEHPKLAHKVLELEDISAAALGEGITDAFCALGTTIKAAGSQWGFLKVDLEGVGRFAVSAKEAGAARFMLVSAVGADAGSFVFYSRIKGQAENEVVMKGFESVVIARPSLLLGQRREVRLGERLSEPVMKLLNPFLLGPLRKYRAVQAERVAEALIRASLDAQPGRIILEGATLGV